MYLLTYLYMTFTMDDKSMLGGEGVAALEHQK